MLQRLQDRSIRGPHRLGRQWPSNPEHWRRHDLRCCCVCKRAGRQTGDKRRSRRRGMKERRRRLRTIIYRLAIGDFRGDLETTPPTCTRGCGIEGWRDPRSKPKSETLAVAPRSSKAQAQTETQGQGQGQWTRTQKEGTRGTSSK